MKKTLFSMCIVLLLTTCAAQSQTTASGASFDSQATGAARKLDDKPRSDPSARFASRYSHLPLSFEANVGQTDARVQYLSHAPGYALFLQPDAATLSLNRAMLRRTADRGETKPRQGQSSVIRMRLLGASATAKGHGDEMLPGKTNYLLGNDPANWNANIPNYRRVRYAQVYPGIDLVYYGTNGQLEYDFELSAGADPSRIRMHFDGVVPSIGPAGDVDLKLAGSPIMLKRPVLYQQVDGRKVKVSGDFALNHDGDLVFVTGTYDRSVPLVIDPLLQFSSYLGGVTANNTQINGMAVDSTGAIYVTGTTAQTDFPVTTGAAITTCPSDLSGSKCGPFSPGTAFVSKIAADGQSLVYSTYIGGSGSQNGSEQGNAIAIDAAGEAWVAGVTSSPSFPITSDAIEPYCNPQSPNPFAGQSGVQSPCGDSQFLVKLNAAGSAISYGTFFGGTQGTFVTAVALDANGDVFFTGTDSGSDFPAAGPYTRSGIYVLDSAGNYLYPTTTSAFQQTGPEFQFGYLTELSADGHRLLYSTIFASPSTSAAGRTFSFALAVNGSRATIGGRTNSSSLPVTAGAAQNTCTANANNCIIYVPWLASFDTSKSGAASLVFSTYLEGPSQVPSSGNDDQITALAADPSGNIFAGGYTQQPLFPTTAGAFQPTCKTVDQGFGPLCNTGFVTRLTPAGAITWSTFFGTTGGDGQTGGIALALDSSDNVYVADGNAPSDTPTNGSLMAATNGSAYVAELSSDGASEPFGTFYGNGGVVNVSAIAVNASNDIFLVGSSTESIPLVNAYQSVNSNGGGSEGFFTKISHLSVSSTSLTVTPSTTITGRDVTFTATVAGTTQTTPAPTGTVTLINTSVTPNIMLGTIQLKNGTGTFVTKQLAAGSYSVTASYAGDDVYSTSTSGVVKATINTPAAASLALTVPATATFGASVVLSAAVSGAGATPTGTASFYDGGTLIGSGTLASGVATYSTGSFALGAHTITAIYSGDGVYGEAISSSASIDVTTAATVTLTAPATAMLGSPVTLSIAVTGTSAVPTGTVMFLDGTTTLGSATLSGGKASYSTSSLAKGAHSISVHYGGDTEYTAGTSAVVTVTIDTLTPTVALSVPATSNAGSAVTLGATISGTGAVPTGTVKFLDGTTTLNSATLAGGKASFSASALSIGAHSITAQYSGDSNYAAGTSTVSTLTVNALTPVVALTISPLTVAAGAPIALSVTVSATAGMPTGSVKFLDGTMVLDTATLVSGSASYSTTALAAGTHSITASYNGDAVFAPLATAAQTVNITAVPPRVTLTSDKTQLVIVRGKSGSTTITATPTGGYTGTIALSCGTLPPDVSCFFSTTTITITSTSPATSTLTISTAATQARLEALPGWPTAVRTLVALLLPMLVFTRKRRRGKRGPWIVLPVLLLCLLGGGTMIGCGGGGSNPATTPPGNYSITINANGGATNPLNLQITVQ